MWKESSRNENDILSLRIGVWIEEPKKIVGLYPASQIHPLIVDDFILRFIWEKDADRTDREEG